MVMANEIDSCSPLPSFCTSTQMWYRDPTRRPQSPPLSPFTPRAPYDDNRTNNYQSNAINSTTKNDQVMNQINSEVSDQSKNSNLDSGDAIGNLPTSHVDLGAMGEAVRAINRSPGSVMNDAGARDPQTSARERTTLEELT